MIILGIDPGKKGALALLDTDGNTVETHDMPDTTRGLHDLIAGLPLIRVAVVEKPFAGPMMSKASFGKFCLGYGILIGALAWRDIPFHEVRPTDWKTSLNVSTDKNRARERASQFFPTNADQWTRVKDDGRAEAALIAWYGLRWTK